MQIRTLISLIFAFLLLSTANLVKAQEQVIVIDTSDYLPLPDGLNYNLSIAASKGNVFEIHRLIKKGADIYEQDYIGATPLIYAVANNKLTSVKALLSYDPEIDFLTNEGESPLHIAAKYGLIEIGEELIRNGANVDIQDHIGSTPIHYSVIYNDIYFTDMLIYYNASVETKSNDGTTPLIAAVWTGDAELSDLLIQSGANPEATDNDGFTPLMVAAQNGDTLIAELVLKNGANLYATNRYGYNTLDVSIRADQPEMVEYLLKKMRLNRKTEQKGADPISIAKSYGRRDIIKILEQYGIKSNPGLNFDQVSVTGYTKICLHDIYIGSGVVFTDPFHNVKLSAGIDFKPGFTRVLVEDSENSYSQYLDKRYVFYVGGGKDISLSENYLTGNYNLELNLNIGYMFCSQYSGTYITPENRVVVLPSMIIRWSKKPVNLYFGYEYMNTGLYKAGPNWLKAGVSVNIYFNSYRAPLKDIKWY